MSLKLSVRRQLTRSVNIERDRESLEFTEFYVPTSRALRTIDQLIKVLEEGSRDRAWSLIGPYGSGKSSFALFLSRLLNQDLSLSQPAVSLLKTASPELAAALISQEPRFLVVSVVGSPEPLGLKLIRALLTQAESFFNSRRGRNPKVLQELHNLVESKAASHSEVLLLIRQLIQDLKKAGLNGMLIVVDELGKFLEYEVRHYGANDIFLLQSLAEECAKPSDFNLLCTVLLHQSMESYAKGLSDTLRNEWGKVQGRFEEVPFLESTEQILKVIGKVFIHDLSSKEKRAIEKSYSENLKQELLQELLPSTLESRERKKLLESCYPLHPISALMLPHLCQKLAQNERTLFSFLGSKEEFGLLTLIQTLSLGHFVMPHHLYDYFVRNQSISMADFVSQKRWVEVITALDRGLGLGELDNHVLKTIGLLNIMGARGQLKASAEVLRLCFPDVKKLNKSLEFLAKESLITLQRFNGEYRVWQGSDFDLEMEIQQELASLGQFPLAEELNQSELLVPIVAKRHSIEGGALRYFNPVFVDARSYLRIARQSDNPRIIIFLAYASDDVRLFDLLSKHFDKGDVLVQCASSENIRDAVAEVIALRKIGSGNYELLRDPVAKREFQERYTAAQSYEKTILDSFFQQPERFLWRFRAKELSVESKRGLQVALSSCLDQLYSLSPVFRNELINRDRPSAQAIMARNKLMAAMVEHGHQTELGFSPKSFPAEKAMYRALLLSPGIHENDTGVSESAAFVKPSKDSASNIGPVWEKIEEFWVSCQSEPKSIVDLNKELISPPYGVKAGVLPVLYIASYLVNQGSLAVFEQRKFRPQFTVEMAERFSKRPDEFTFQYIDFESNENLFAQYQALIRDGSGNRVEVGSYMELVRPLARLMASLPEYTQVTREGLSSKAIKLRSAFDIAKAPNDLILYDIPRALGFEHNDSLDFEFEKFGEALAYTLKELQVCHEVMRQKFVDVISKEGLGRSENLNLTELRKACGNLYGLEAFAPQGQSLSGFITRLTKVEADDEEWLENVLMYLGRKPSAKWGDSDFGEAMYRLKAALREIRDLEKIRIQMKSESLETEDIDFYLLKMVRKGFEPKDKVVVIDAGMKERLKKVISKVEDSLDELDEDLREACVALLMESIASDDETMPKFSSKRLKLVQDESK